MTTRIEIDKFDGTGDFGLWKLKIRALMAHQGCEEALDGEEAFSTTMDAAEKKKILRKGMSSTVLNLSDPIIKEIQNNTTAKDRGSSAIIKLDLLKAYDRLSWSFLSSMLSAFGFSQSWIDLIMRTINCCHFSVIVNGEASGFIRAGHDIRQGDPLSPSLFILAGEFFSRGLNNLLNSSPSLSYCAKKGLPISHLAYADDCIIFSRGNKDGLSKIMKFLVLYKNVSGQKINVSKSSIILQKLE